MKFSALLIAATLFSSLSWGLSKVPECAKKPEFSTQGRLIGSIKSLPSLVYVGKSADYYVESKGSGIRMWGEQSFLKAESRIACATAAAGKSQSFSIYAPTLIDLTGEKKIGDSYWQFHMVNNDKEFGVWNRQSRLFSKSKDLEEGLAQMGVQTQVIQVSHSEYNVVFTRETEQSTETLVIRFDSYLKIP